MLKANKGLIQIEGNETLIRAEFSTLCKAMREVLEEDYDADTVDKMLNEDLADSKLSEAELKERLAENVAKMFKEKDIDSIINILKGML